jgi:hypothetical protein
VIVPKPLPFHDRSRLAQVILGAIVPAAIGVVAGILLGASSAAYWIVAVLAAVGAVLAGLEHPDARGGAARGLVGGAIYGAALLIAHAVAGTHAKVSLGSFPPLLAVITAIIGAALGALGAWSGGSLR